MAQNKKPYNSKFKAEEIEKAIQSLYKDSVFGGVAHPNDPDPKPVGNTVYLATEVGTYTNYGGVRMTEEGLAIITYKENSDKFWGIKQLIGDPYIEPVFRTSSRLAVWYAPSAKALTIDRVSKQVIIDGEISFHFGGDVCIFFNQKVTCGLYDSTAAYSSYQKILLNIKTNKIFPKRYTYKNTKDEVTLMFIALKGENKDFNEVRVSGGNYFYEDGSEHNSFLAIEKIENKQEDGLCALNKGISGFASLFFNTEREHSSDLDRLNVNIKRGELFNVYLDSEPYYESCTSILYIKSDEGEISQRSIKVRQYNSIIAPFNISSAGIYIGPSTPGKYYFEIKYGNALEMESVPLKLNGQSVEYDYKGTGSTQRMEKIPKIVFFKNKVYEITLSSDTGITWAGNTDQSAFIEIWGDKAIFTLDKNQKFTSPTKIIYNCTKDFDDIEIGGRWHPEEILKIKVVQKSIDADITEIREIISGTPDKPRDILYLNSDKSDAIKGFAKQNNVEPSSYEKIPMLSLIHMSDMHGGELEVERIIEFANSIKRTDLKEGGVDIVVNTGDIVVNLYEESFAWYDEVVNKAKLPVYHILGNHDVRQTKGATNQDIFNKYFANYIARWGFKPGEHLDNEPYYYKDFPEQHVRMFFNDDYRVIDGEYASNAMSQQQVDFFINAMKTTPEGWGFVHCSHQPAAEFGAAENEFCSPFRVDGRTNGSSTRNEHLIANLVQAFMDKTTFKKTITQYIPSKDAVVLDVDADFTNCKGIFACYLCGHTHSDSICHLRDFPKQVVLNVGCTTKKYIGGSDIQQREPNTQSHDLFNMVSIDMNLRQISVLRIGARFTSHGQERRCTYINF